MSDTVKLKGAVVGARQGAGQEQQVATPKKMSDSVRADAGGAARTRGPCAPAQRHHRRVLDRVEARGAVLHHLAHLAEVTGRRDETEQN
jgi:hypothetical protein